MDEQTTLNDLLALNLHEFEDEVRNIVDKATKELNMEKVFWIQGKFLRVQICEIDIADSLLSVIQLFRLIFTMASNLCWKLSKSSEKKFLNSSDQTRQVAQITELICIISTTRSMTFIE